MAQLGVNAHGEVLEPGRVPDCYLGLLLDPPSGQHPGRVLVVAPASLLHPCIPQPEDDVPPGWPGHEADQVAVGLHGPLVGAQWVADQRRARAKQRQVPRVGIAVAGRGGAVAVRVDAGCPLTGGTCRPRRTRRRA